MIPFEGIAITWSTAAFEEGTRHNGAARLFPESRHRSRRIHKKLCRRFGGEFARKPAMFRVGGRIVAHPALRGQIEHAMRPAVAERRAAAIAERQIAPLAAPIQQANGGW